MTENENRVIKLKNISKIYKMGEELVYALRDVSLSINHNEYVAIMGPSGSGKSTMMNILGCLDSPTGGFYELDGDDVSQLEDNKLAEIRNKKIGFVFQSFNLLARATILDNVELPLIYSGINKSKRKELARKVLESVKLDDRLKHKPNELSGGQRQRVAIARALVCDPQIILADEPTGALDSKTGLEIMQMLKELNDMGQTIIVITHDVNIANMAKRKIALSDGKIVGETNIA